MMSAVGDEDSTTDPPTDTHNMNSNTYTAPHASSDNFVFPLRVPPAPDQTTRRQQPQEQDGELDLDPHGC